MRKVFPETPPKSVKFQKKDEIPLNYAVHSALANFRGLVSDWSV